MARGDKRGIGTLLEGCGTALFQGLLWAGGLRAAYTILDPVAFCYALLHPGVRRSTRPYIEARFGPSGPFKRLKHTFMIVRSFGRAMIDTAWIKKRGGASSFHRNIVGERILMETVTAGRGTILLTAHTGNWQTAIAHLPALPVKVNALMHHQGGKEAEEVALKASCGKNPLNLIRNDGFMGGMIEATTALQQGEVVTIMGDRWVRGPCAQVEFLGKVARFPLAPYILASATGATVLVMLAAKTGEMTYEVKIHDTFKVPPLKRRERTTGAAPHAARFARCLERHLGDYPHQWYNFYDFWSLEGPEGARPPTDLAPGAAQIMRRRDGGDKETAKGDDHQGSEARRPHP